MCSAIFDVLVTSCSFNTCLDSSFQAHGQNQRKVGMWVRGGVRWVQGNMVGGKWRQLEQ